MHIVESVSTCNRAPDILGRCKVIRLPRPAPPTHGWCTPQWSALRFPLDLQNPRPRLQTEGRERGTFILTSVRANKLSRSFVSWLDSSRSLKYSVSLTVHPDFGRGTNNHLSGQAMHRATSVGCVSVRVI